MNISMIKQDAKNMLKGNRLNSFLVLIIPVIFQFIISLFFGKIMNEKNLISVVITIIDYLIVFLLQLGCISYFLKMSRNEEVKIEEVFSKSSILIKAIIISIISGALLYLGTFLGIFSMAIGMVGTLDYGNTNIFFGWLSILGLVSLVMDIIGIILLFAYSMALYLLIDNPQIGIIKALKESRIMMKGHKWEYFCLVLNIIALPIIIFVIIFGIINLSIESIWGGLFLYLIIMIGAWIYMIVNVIPHLYLANSIFYDALLANENNSDNINNSDNVNNI